MLGDVDGDGEITINDVTMTISAALGRPAAIFISAAADVDGDGEITINDVTTIIGMALGKIKL
jgi:Ca2+-binding EF-hand superfamily protein